mgnify:CR=1 FL=1
MPHVELIWQVFWRKELQFCKTAQELAPDEMLRRMYSELEDLVTSIQKVPRVPSPHLAVAFEHW